MPATGGVGQIEASFIDGGKVMANVTGDAIKGRGSRWRMAGWSIAALLLLLPLVAMQFTAEVNWTVGDFFFAGLMIGVVGLAFELAVRMSDSWAYRAGVGCALAASFMIVWAGGAVGMIGDEGNPYNLLFVGVIGLALVGAILTRFRARGLALTMVVAAVAHLVVAAVGMASDLRGGVFSAMFAGLWLLAAALFHNAASEPATERPPA